ncbi:Fe-S cluster domain-containing protein [Desulfovibrio sp. OttesenSCG-928-A18]|nr:Fe-S cluster domain-containing protein [Desulfovibrio sp. OttesenSCG-928-A18]
MVITSILALLGLGAAAAIILAVASHLLKVEENPLIEMIAEHLPGANCGGCGFAGCEAYAAAVVANSDIPANMCTVGGAAVAAKVGELTGKVVKAGEPMVSLRRCSREEGHVEKKFEYVGTATCASAALLEGGPYKCTWACLGLGDCMRACPFDAMYMENGMVEIIASKCVSCGQCVKACPRSIPQLIPRRARVMNYCATREKLKSVSDVCDVGCINCLKCLKACPADAIAYEKRRIEIDHLACLKYGRACNEACVAACPRGIMRSRGTSAMLEETINAVQEAALADPPASQPPSSPPMDPPRPEPLQIQKVPAQPCSADSNAGADTSASPATAAEEAKS